MIDALLIAPFIFAGVASLLLGKRSKRYASYLSIASALIGTLMATYAVISENVAAVTRYTWIAFGGYSINISLTDAHLNMLLVLLIYIIAPLIMFYSLGFMDKRDEQSRFYFEINMFAAAMILFAISANLLTMIVAWEWLGITSYLLIGFWYHKKRAARAARMSITIIVFGDIAMLAALIVLWSTYGSTSFTYLLSQAASPIISVIGILIALAIFTKSAQFPFMGWLAEAMEGPTPVSAFLHSSTMVKAGVFLAIVLMPIFYETHILNLFLLFGIITALIGITNAVSAKHIKKILAYSTMEDLGLMMVAVGLNSIAAAIFFFVVQTFYKALLFLDAGAVMRANGEKESIFEMRGSRSNRLLFATMAIGALSIAGIFPFSGFLGKIGIDAQAATNIPLYAILIAIDFVSSAYIFRWLFVPMRQTSDTVLIGRYKRLPKSMVLPGVILAVSVFAADIIYFKLPAYLSIASISVGALHAVIESVAVALGLIISYYVYARSHMLKRHKSISMLLHNQLITEALYYSVGSVFYKVGYAFEYFEIYLYRFVKIIGALVYEAGGQIRRSVNGDVNLYVAGVAIGFIIMLLFVVFYL